MSLRRADPSSRGVNFKTEAVLARLVISPVESEDLTLQFYSAVPLKRDTNWRVAES